MEAVITAVIAAKHATELVHATKACCSAVQRKATKQLTVTHASVPVAVPGGQLLPAGLVAENVTLAGTMLPGSTALSTVDRVVCTSGSENTEGARSLVPGPITLNSSVKTATGVEKNVVVGARVGLRVGEGVLTGLACSKFMVFGKACFLL